MNLSKTMETALKAAWIAAGITKTDAFYNAFQVPEKDAKGIVSRRFPQIKYACAPDVPRGHNEPFRQIATACGIITVAADDPERLIIAGLYEKARTMVDTANSDVNSWSTTYLATGIHLTAIVLDSANPPYFDEEWCIIEMPFTVEVCVD